MRLFIVLKMIPKKKCASIFKTHDSKCNIKCQQKLYFQSYFLANHTSTFISDILIHVQLKSKLIQTKGKRIFCYKLSLHRNIYMRIIQ